MNILGLTAFSHESSAAVIVDGKLTAHIGQERLNRQKHTAKFPKEAIKLALKTSGLAPNQIDHITFFWSPYLELTGNIRHFIQFFPQSLNLFLTHSGSSDHSALGRINSAIRLKSYLTTVSTRLAKKPIHYMPHHLSHAASTFFVSPFQSSAVLILDGRGEATTTLQAYGQRNHLQTLSETKIPHSLGLLYSAVTGYLGFKPFSDEGIVMGLSAYGNKSLVSKMKTLVELKPKGQYKLNLDFFSFHIKGRKQWLSRKFITTFGPPRAKGDKITTRHQNIAKALQLVLETSSLHIARHLYNQTKSPNLCLAGGVALNCLVNRRLKEETNFKNIFIQPIAHDGGAAMGSALLFFHQTLDQPRNYLFSTPYLGPSFTDPQILSALKKSNLKYKKLKNISKSAARSIANGKIVAWFQGPMEAGPRALGNRSILADPRNSKTKDLLNQKVKHREWFRPFSPSILKEDSTKFFDLDNSPYMILISNAKKSVYKKIPAVLHIDNTARSQTVDKKTNPKYWQLINEFKKLTNIPLVLNTSFNDSEPIVATPEHAINTFKKTDIDVLAIGNYLVTKPK